MFCGILFYEFIIFFGSRKCLIIFEFDFLFLLDRILCLELDEELDM